MKMCQTWDSDLEGNSDSERVGDTDWRVCLSEEESICCHVWDILEEKLEVKGDDSVTQHLDFDLTCLNPSVLATSYVAFMPFKGIVGRAPAILNIKCFFLNNKYNSASF